MQPSSAADPAGHAPPATEPLAIEFDDIVYSLQSFGGISEYWHEMTSRIEARSDFAVTRRGGGTWGRMRTLKTHCRVFHSSYYRTARGSSTRSVTTVHDLAYELGHVGNRAKRALHVLEHRRAYFASDALICVSESTRRDLLQFYPALAGQCPVFVIRHGLTPLPAGAHTPPEQGPDRPYVLFVGGRSDYKNFGNALAGFAASGLAGSGCLLVCTGLPFTADETERIGGLGLDRSVRSLGRVDRGQLAGLYRSAHCLLYPSLFEGFGLPVIEAMQLGCPVIAADRSALPEVASGAALLVDTRLPDAIAAALREIGDPPTRQRLIAAGLARAAEFSWDRCAALHADVYRSLA